MGIHILCPTRWTVRGDALAAFFDNCSELMDLWGLVSKLLVAQMKARLRGVKVVMSTFLLPNFFFCHVRIFV